MGFLFGLGLGAVGMFLLYGNNKKKMNSLYDQLKKAKDTVELLQAKEEMKKEIKVWPED